jgi:hypothetical protein
MKRSLLVAAASAAFALAGCEDGPNQNFNPSPAGAGGIWNNGNSPGNANSGKQNYTDNGSTGTNRNEICDVDKKHKVWAEMVKKPIHPPSVGGGLDVAGGPNGDGIPDPNNDLSKESWTGLTLDTAEKINCQSTFGYDVYGDGAVFDAYWGDNGEVQVSYLVSTRQITSVTLAQGYLGTLDVTSADKAHKYSIGIGVPISLDKAPLALNWNDKVDFNAKVNAMYNAVTSTYSPFQPEPDCFATGHCISKQLTDQYAYIWFTTVGFIMIFQNPYMSTTLGATPIQVEQDKTKVLGFTDASVLLQNDPAGVGPLVHRPNVFGSGKDCNFQLNQTFGAFRDSCVGPLTDTTKNKAELTKLLSGLSHGAETYGLDVVGVDPGFQAVSLKDQEIILDGQLPKDADIGYGLYVDQNTAGAFANDWVNNDPWAANKKQDWHGYGLLTLQWATRLQAAFNKATGNVHPIGDPACLNKSNAAMKAAGCSGLEGIVTTAPHNARAQGNDVNALGDAPLNGNPNDQVGKAKFFTGMSPGMKPTTWQVFYCQDGAGLNGSQLSGYSPEKCNVNGGSPEDISYFKHTLNQLIAVAGGGKLNALPLDFQDIRFLFKEWIFALVQYLGVAGDLSKQTLADMSAIAVDQNNLFFDSIGSGQFEFAEYIDRRNVKDGLPPLDVRMTADILHAIINDYDFTRTLYRGESALYSAMRGGSTAPLGKDNNVFLTNIFGSPTLGGIYKDSADTAKTPYHDYDCAVNDHTVVAIDKACNGLGAPVDGAGVPLKNDDGTLLLAPYKGAFTGTDFTVGTKSAITPLSIPPLIQHIWVEIPVHQDPYDTSSQNLTPVRKLIPWLPEGASVGFPIAINGQQDKWIQTFQMDFSGVTISANVDYHMVDGPLAGSKVVKVEAVETTDFLGEVFLCADPSLDPTVDADAILHVRMYSPASTITTWFQNHPAAVSQCGIIYQYSQFGNYIDTVTSTTNGVRLGINPGGGQGRIIDVTLYDTTTAAQ